MRLHHIRTAINGYGEAVQYFEGCTPWRSKPNDPRPLQERRNKIMSVRRKPSGDIAFRYHDTDVVVWHKDNTFTVNTYASQSTDVFCNGFTPRGFVSHMVSDFMRLETPDGTRFYKTRPIMEFQPLPAGVVMLTEPDPFTKYRVDRVRIKEARQESGYAAFALWAKAYEAMTSPARPTRQWDIRQSPGRNWGNAFLLEMLRDNTKWEQLTMAFPTVGACLAACDRAVKLTYDAFVGEPIPFVTSWAEMEAIRRSHKLRYA